MKRIIKILIFAILIFNNNLMAAENKAIYDYNFIDIGWLKIK